MNAVSPESSSFTDDAEQLDNHEGWEYRVDSLDQDYFKHRPLEY